MKKVIQNWMYVVIIACSFVAGCKKENPNTNVSINSQTKDGNPNQPFNWETSTRMMPSPVSPNDPLNPTLPWTSQSGSYIDPDLAADFKSSDGWTLVYNTFNPNFYQQNEANGGLYFALYNIYRGLLRFYLYIPSGNASGGAAIENGLGVYHTSGNTSSMLNFNGVEIVDAATNVLTFTQTNNVGVAYSGGWYAMQYEIAYDPAINTNTTTYPNLGLAWNSRTVDISKIVLDGTQQGTITGNITQQSSGFNWSGSLTNLGLLGLEVYGAGGFSGLSSQAGSNGFTGYQTAAQGGLSGTISGLFSAIFGGSTNNPQEVNLNMSGAISMQGTLTSPNPLAPNSFVLPGASTSYSANNNSWPSLYANTMGVFNLSGRPTIRESVLGPSLLQSPSSPYYNYNSYQRYYYIDPSSFTIQWNPANPISFSNVDIKEEIVLLGLPADLDAGISSSFTLPASGVPLNNTKLYASSTAKKETVGGNNIYTGTGTITEKFAQSGSSFTVPPDVSQVAVRISFTMNPSGIPPITIVKTFLANLVQ